MSQDYALTIAGELTVRKEQVTAVIGLLDEDNTIPFIARYRKEMTGGLDEEQIRTIETTLSRLRKLDERKAAVLASIEEQGKLTADLRLRILAAGTLTLVEDLYQPFKPRRKTRADTARELGLQPLAELILRQAAEPISVVDAAVPFVGDDVLTTEDALAGARDIVAETIADHAEVRSRLREKAMQWGSLISTRIKNAEDDKGVFETYYEFEFRIDRLRPHQVLAINRGEQEKVLRVKVQVSERDWRGAIGETFYVRSGSPFSGQLQAAIDDAAQRLLLPAIERDVRRTLSEQAEDHAIHVFATNLRALLTLPPLDGYIVMGIDPGFRTGSKVAVIDVTGKVLDTVTIYPHPPQNQRKEAFDILADLVSQHGVNLIAVGNGTASRETEQLVAELPGKTKTVKYLIVNEAGASVYSASPLARAELPDMDVSIRGAVSIARRVQDPLAELVKIDPKSIGVGMYQHDVDQKKLTGMLDAVVESVVNQVGVEVNTASPALLGYVAGIGRKLAEKMVADRDKNGPFKNRTDIRRIAGLGPKAFEQAAGFLRIRGGQNPLDASAIHPESYQVANKVLKASGLDPRSSQAEREAKIAKFRAQNSLVDLAGKLNTGIPTLEDILDQLARPGRDPRADLPAPILRSDVVSMDDLAAGMDLKGTVRNVVDFGAFIDIGVKQDGLLHRSQIPRGLQLKVGQIVQVEIISIDKERGRISLGWAHPRTAGRE